MNESARNPSIDWALLSLWIFLSMLLFALLSFGTAPIRAASLSRAVDAALSEAGDARRTEAALPTRGADGRKSLHGKRFSLKNKKGVAVVFTVDASTSAGTYVAVFGPSGELTSVLGLDRSSPSGKTLPFLAWTYAQGIALSEKRK